MQARSILLSSIIGALVLLAGFTAPSTAVAGSVGVFSATGFHSGNSLTSEEDSATWLNQGAGIELELGSKNSRVTGRARGFYLGAFGAGGPLHQGGATFGITVRILPDLEKPFNVYALVDLGGAFAIVDHMEGLYGQIGAGFFHNIGQAPMRFFVEAAFELRYRQVVHSGAKVNIGVRFLLD